MMEAKEYLSIALGGNMNIGTLTLSAWYDIMEGYARHKFIEKTSAKTSHNSGKGLKNKFDRPENCPDIYQM